MASRREEELLLEVDALRAELAAERERNRHANEKLAMLGTAVDHLEEIVFITEAFARDAGGRRIVFVNRTFTRLTGHPAEEVIGKNPSITIGADTDRATLKRIETRLRAAEPVHEELLKYRKDGTSFWVAIDILPVKDAEGNHTHWLSVQRDITEWRAIQARMIETERLASLGTLSAGIAHEIKNPLGYATLNVEFAQRKLDQLVKSLEAGEAWDREKTLAWASRVRSILESARDGGEKVQEIARDLKLLARSTDGDVPTVDVERVLDAALRIVHAQIRPVARLERMPSAVTAVRAHATRLGQVFINLVMNAVEAFATVEKRPGHSNCIVIRSVAEAGWVDVSVEDNGPGIPEATRANLFQPFFTTKGSREGTGLGLFISRAIVESMGGKLELGPPTPGKGTTFIVRLPAAETAPDAEVESER